MLMWIFFNFSTGCFRLFSTGYFQLFNNGCFQLFLTNRKLISFLNSSLQKSQHLSRQLPVIHCAIIQNIFRGGVISANAYQHTFLYLLCFFIHTAIRKYQPALHRSVKNIYICVRDTVFIVCNLYAEDCASHSHSGIRRIHLINRLRTKLAVQSADKSAGFQIESRSAVCTRSGGFHAHSAFRLQQGKLILIHLKIQAAFFICTYCIA